MIQGRSVLAIIPARGGSKGLPGKNVRSLAGKPLIAWTIQAAKASRWIDRVILSSDDASIIQVAQRWGCDVPFVREAHLATDEATTVDVVLDAIQRCPGYEWIVVLQPTSPLRLSEDIDGCLSACVDRNLPAAVSVCESPVSPYWMFSRDQKGCLETLLPLPPDVSRRQDLPPTYQLNGAVYAVQSTWFKVNARFITPQTYAYVMPVQRSIDIDDATDFSLAQQLLAARTLPADGDASAADSLA